MWKNKRVLVLGATGLVGSHCVEALLKKNTNITIFTHKKPNFFGDQVEEISGDLTEPETCHKLLKDFDFIIHAAAQTGGLAKNQNDPISTLIPNARMNLNILEAVEKNPPDVFHFSSNNSIYPDVDWPLKENEAQVPISGIASHYSQIKILAENHCRYLYDKKNIQISITRGANAYGPHDNFDPITSHTVPANIRKVVERQNPMVIWSDGSALRDYIHGQDLADGILLTMEKYHTAEPINIATGIHTSVSELVKLICKIDGFEDAKLEYDKSKPGGPKMKLMSTEKAKRILNYTSKISLEDGLHNTINWYKENITKN
ncbi:MAG: NAD-dependent epimerase/dehydratase family protein [Candidatus Nitrosopumilus sp. bin_7KS]